MRVSRRTLLQGGAASAMALMGAPRARAVAGFDHSHQALTVLLRAYSRDGEVAYGELQAEQKALDAYLASLAAVTPGDYRGFSREQKLAYWLNAYNAHALNMVVSHWPVMSIRKVAGDGIKVPCVQGGLLGRGRLSLTVVEKQVLAQLGDARVFLAAVPAARGGPSLRESAYRADAVDSQLEDAAWRFVEDPDKNMLHAGGSRMRLNAVFQWHRAAFEKDARSLVRFVARYVRSDDEGAAGRSPVVAFTPFDWSVNGH